MRNSAATKDRKTKIASMLTLILPGFLWSTVFPLSKMLLEVMEPTTLAAIRFSVGAICLLLSACWRFSPAGVWAAWKRRSATFFLLGFFGFFINNYLQNLGLKLSTSSSTSLLSSMDPIFTTLLSALILKETLTRRKLTGLLLAFGGVFLVTTNGQFSFDWSGGLGNLLVVISALGYSFYTIFSKIILEEEEPAIVVALSTTIGAILLCTVAFLFDTPTDWSLLSTGQLWILVYLSIVPTALPVVIYSYLLRDIDASQAAITVFLIPGFSLIWSVLLLKEQLTWAMLLGGLLIVFGVLISMSQNFVSTATDDDIDGDDDTTYEVAGGTSN